MLCRLTFKNVVFIKKTHLMYFSSPQSFLWTRPTWRQKSNQKFSSCTARELALLAIH